MKELLNTLAAGDVNIADCKVTRMDIRYSYSKVYKQLGLAFKESWEDDNLMLDTANDFLLSIAKYILEENIKARDVLIEIHPCWVKYLINASNSYKTVTNNCGFFYNDNKKYFINDSNGYRVINNNGSFFYNDKKGFSGLIEITKDLKLYVPIWNTHNSVVKTMVCIN